MRPTGICADARAKYTLETQQATGDWVMHVANLCSTERESRYLVFKRPHLLTVSKSPPVYGPVLGKFVWLKFIQPTGLTNQITHHLIYLILLT